VAEEACSKQSQTEKIKKNKKDYKGIGELLL
jgi:hypothetical protein